MKSATQPNRVTMENLVRRLSWTSPFVLALIVTLLNCAKPVVIDDTAYLAFARHIAQHPFDPYGFNIFWYSEPEPAMTVLAPPVLPYWLAMGIRVFGEHVGLLKLWLFPFIWLLAWSLDGLLRRFARGTERVALPLLMLSPAVIPIVNLMLDIPALALGLAAIHFFGVGVERRHIKFALASGLLAALAMQTKYTMLLVPPILLWYGITHRAIRFALVAIAVAIGGASGPEIASHVQYGQSHFLYHVRQQQPDDQHGGWKQTLEEKYALTAPLAGHLGLLAAGFGLYTARAVGVPRRILMIGAALWIIGIALIAVLPYHDSVLIWGKQPGREKLTLHSTVWRTAGTATLLIALACTWLLLIRTRSGIRWRGNRDSLFLVGWVLAELAAYYVLTPFPAARRVIGVSIALALLAARTVSRIERVRPNRRVPEWVLPLTVTVGMFVALLDTFDAYPEKVLAERASETVRRTELHPNVWYAGHWGFQYYCERSGMHPAIRGRTIVEPGDFLVWPLIPDQNGFCRPNNFNVPPQPPAEVGELIAFHVWDDPLSAQTIPNFYGGSDPIVGRDHPRLRLGIYRIKRPWLVGEAWPLHERPHAIDLLRGRFPGDE